MHARKGFTLIELLVVIAIIALLMSILMPAMNRVKKQARTVACLAQMKQWGLWFSMYAEDNDGYYNIDYTKLTPLLIEAIKELKLKNDELEKKNEDLTRRIENLEAH